MTENRTVTSRRLSDIEIARVCHEINKAYCESLGDHSQSGWDSSPQWQKDSAIAGVAFHIEGLFGGASHGPEASHESWMAQKVADGWTYGPIKNPDIKQHPCIVPFDKLPKDQQAKDYIFRAVVHALAIID